MRPLLDVAPVREVQAAYFGLLRQFFEGPYREMMKHSLSPSQIAEGMSQTPSLVNAFEKERFAIIKGFAEFWKVTQSTVNEYLGELKAMKSFFGGDISPIVDLKHFSSTLLYTDTVVLQCPVLRLMPIVEMGVVQESFRLLAKHALNVMRFEELALADVEPPILLITGAAFALDEEYSDQLIKASEPYVLSQAKALLDRDFENSRELQEFIFGMETVEEALESIKDSTRALFDTEWSGSVEEQLRRSVRELAGSLRMPGDFNQVGFVLHNLTSGRMVQANEIVLLNSSIGATPLLSAPTSWQYLLWRYEYDAANTDLGIDPKDLLITNAILSREDRKEIPLISGLSIKSIVALRREGAMAPLRELMRESISRIDLAAPHELKAVSGEVSRLLGEAFDSHYRDLAEVKASKKRFYGIDVASSIATGALTIAGAATGNIPLTTVGALSALLLGSKSVAAFKDGWQEMKTKDSQLKRSPAAILLRNLD